MKVFIAASWLRLGGGVTRTLIELLKRIDYEKYDVTLMLMEKDDSVLSYLPKQVKVIEAKEKFQTMTPKAILKSMIKKGKFVSAISYLINMIDWKINADSYRHQHWLAKHSSKQDEAYDIAISYAMMDSFVNQYVIDCVKAKRKIMWCHVDINIYKEKYISGLEKTYNKYDRINCVSRYCKNALEVKYPQLSDKLNVAYNFIDADKIREQSLAVPDVDLPQNTLKLCTVGRITDQKAIDILVDTAELLDKEKVDFVWWVIGTKYNDGFNELVKNKITKAHLESKVLLLGEKNPPYPYMNACDIYVQTSRFEGFCTTTNEARILLKPIVTTCVSGADEQFVNGINGSITEISAESIFKEIYKLYTHPEICSTYINNLKSGFELNQHNTFEGMIL